MVEGFSSAMAYPHIITITAITHDDRRDKRQLVKFRLSSRIVVSAIAHVIPSSSNCRLYSSLLILVNLLIGLIASTCVLGAPGAVILNYHHVSEAEDGIATITLTRFEQHLKYLGKAGCTIVSLREVCNYLEGSGSLPKKAVCITFDDGYVSYSRLAAPLLAKYGYSSTCFVIVADASRSQAKGRLPHMTWEEMGRLKSDRLIYFGSHTYDTHALHPHSTQECVMSTLAHRIRVGGKQESLQEYKKRVTDDLRKAKELMENRLVKTVDVLAYPFGSVSDELIQAARSVGYRFGFTTDTGAVNASTDRWRIPRINAGSSWVTVDYLAARLASYLITKPLPAR